MVILPFVINYTVNYSYYVDELGDINDDHNKNYPSSLFAEAGRVPVMCSHRGEG